MRSTYFLELDTVVLSIADNVTPVTATPPAGTKAMKLTATGQNVDFSTNGVAPVVGSSHRVIAGAQPLYVEWAPDTSEGLKALSTVASAAKLIVTWLGG